ncbi:MAG: pseudouridine synthase [Bacteroidota bacterium]
MEEKKDMRLNRYIAHSGICARRKADIFIKEGFVSVNDKIEYAPGFRVKEGDVVKFKGKVIKPIVNKVYILMNKPKNTITSVKDESGRKTVMDIIEKKVEERVYPVGRLDRNTVGLLLLTNDGALAEKLSHPKYNIKKVYHVTLDRDVAEEHLNAIREGITLEDGPVEVDGVDYYKGRDKNEIGIEIHIGRNRIVRRIFEHFDYNVKALDRVYYAGLTKKDLKRGWFRNLTEQEIVMLKHFT